MEKFVGNTQIVSEINSVLKSQRIGHAYLFSGIMGIGKYTLAKEFAKSILCENADSIKSCGECEACKTFNNSPDFLEVAPEDGLIKVDAIRQVSEELLLKPTISKRKVCIIDDADKMNESSQNALLKILEEPPAFATIIMVTSNKEKLLGTIKSRCVTFNFNKLSNDEVKSVLLEEKIDENVLDLAGGSVGKYLKLKDSNYLETLLIIEEALDSKDLLFINRAVSNLKKVRTIKDDIYDILDILIIKLGNNITKVHNAEKVELLEELGNNISHNANFDTSLDYFMIRLYEINNN